MNPEIILASKSRARNEMLRSAGIKFQSLPADIDESAVIKNRPSNDVALVLAQQKALAISKQNPNAYVIGSDQILTCEGQIFEKASDKSAARAKLETLRGKTHQLISAAAIAKGSEILWHATDAAELTMRNFDDAFLSRYLTAAKDDALSCVGAYALEKSGITLFSDIKGNYHTILGMPFLPLLTYLQDELGIPLL